MYQNPFIVNDIEAAIAQNPANYNLFAALPDLINATRLGKVDWGFAKEMITATISLDINAATIWGNIDNCRNRMSTQEKVIFDGMLPNRRMWYLVSAQKASNKAAELFQNSLLNGKGDALRHVLWNGYSALTIGADLTQQLTTAHESNTNTRPFAWKEKEMDLHNNNRGRYVALYSNLMNIFDNILLAHQSGEMVYFNNLNTSSNELTILSTITPTNQ